MKLVFYCSLVTFTFFSSCGTTIAQKSSHARKITPGVVIRVDDVAPATKGYNAFDARKVVEQSMGQHLLVACDLPQTLVPPSGSSFLETVHLAYAQHHDLVLSPDDIWIQIALGVSIHINEQFKELQPKVLKSAKREEIVVRIDDLTTMKPEHWQQLIDTFTIIAREKIRPDFYKTMLPEFSTSTEHTKTVLNAILLSSVKQGFLFRGASGCGIPNVILLGEKADWELLLKHVKELEQYDLKFWTDELQPILQEFINAFDGKVDRSFWQRMYKYREAYGMTDMNGWISKFFPYFKDEQWVTDPEELAAFDAANPGAEYESLAKPGYKRNPYLAGDDYLLHSIDTGELPTSVCTVPLIWNNYKSTDPKDEEQHLTLHAGFIGAIQQGPDHNLRNNPVWFITRDNDSYELEEYLGSGVNETDFTRYLWSDRVISGPEVNAVYNPAVNRSAAAGNEALKAELRQHLKKAFPKEELTGTTLTFMVSHFGSCMQPQITGGTLSDQAKVALLLKMKKLDAAFSPATILSDKEPELQSVETEQPLVVPVNATMTLVF